MYIYIIIILICILIKIIYRKQIIFIKILSNFINLYDRIFINQCILSYKSSRLEIFIKNRFVEHNIILPFSFLSSLENNDKYHIEGISKNNTMITIANPDGVPYSFSPLELGLISIKVTDIKSSKFKEFKENDKIGIVSNIMKSII